MDILVDILVDILQLEGISPRSVRQEDGFYHIEAEIEHDTMSCRHCTQPNLIGNGSKVTTYRDIPIHNIPVAIYLKRRRYKCKHCNGTSYQTHHAIHDKYQMTNRLWHYIYTNAFDKTFQQIANQVGLDEKTIRRIFKAEIENALADYNPITPTVMGIDEAHLIGGPRLVITNIKESTIINMINNRNKTTLIDYLSQIEDKHKINVVTIDMWQPYLEAVMKVIPHAVVVIDKFHVVKLVQEALEKVRKGLRASLNRSQRLKLKNDRSILRTRRKNLSESQVEAMTSWFEEFPILERAYILKETLMNIYDINSQDKALEEYEYWKTLITDDLKNYFNRVAETIDRWKTYIFNYFDYPYINATTESMNGLIKLMNKNGRGYSFEVLRAKVLLSRSAQKHKKKKNFIRKQALGYGVPEYDSHEYFGSEISTLYAEYKQDK